MKRVTKIEHRYKWWRHFLQNRSPRKLSERGVPVGHINRVEFNELWDQFPEMEKAKLKGEEVHYDRIDNAKGYEKGNIQIITGRANRQKQAAQAYHAEKGQIAAANTNSYDPFEFIN